MMARQQRILDLIEQLENLFNGSPWFGPTWIETLEKIPSEAVNFRLSKGASIAGLLGHVVAWREYVARQLQGQEDVDLLPGADWPVDTVDDRKWQDLVKQLVGLQQELLEGLSELPASMLDETVPGRAYTWAFMIQGLIDHDAYHLGQINLLLKQVLPDPEERN
ncbi:MAG: DinB family protein [Saprospiraceae bacterium]|nr:DinB family protein [Saprospiraceae bacterium]